METQRRLKLGFRVHSSIFSDGSSHEKLMNYLLDRRNVFGRIFLNLKEYLLSYSKSFDEVETITTTKNNIRYTNGTLKGLGNLINQSAIDIAVQPVIVHESSMEMVDFSYPYQLISATFVIRKPEYKPQIFGILQIFSWQLWITILSTLITMCFVYYVGLKQKYILDKVSLHTVAVLLRQGSILKTSSMAENLLVYSWVVGTMFICLALDSVVLIFSDISTE